MKKFYSLLFAFVTVLGLSAQKTVTFDATQDLGSTTDPNSGDQLTKDGVTMQTSTGTFSTSQQFRFYKGATASISAAEGNIVKVEFTCTASGEAKYGPGNLVFDNGSYDYAEKVGTWTGSAASVSFSSVANQTRATQIVVTLDIEGGDTPVDPDPVDPDPVDIAGTGEGTVASPYDVTRALSLIENKANDASAEVYVSGEIVSITEISTQYGNATYAIADPQSEGQLTIFRGKYLGGGKFTSEDQLRPGDKVVVLGKLILYNGTSSQMSGSTLYSLNGKTEGEGGGDEPVDPTPGGDFCTIVGNTTTAVFGNAGLENAADATTFNLTDGTTITFGQGEGNNAPKYYTSGAAIRMYALNTISIAAEKNIASVTISHVATYGGNETLTATPGTLSRDAEKNTIVLSGVNAKNVTVANDHSENKGGTQLRVVSIAVTYVNTGIETIESQQTAGAAYDLSGRRVNAAKKGLYIIGGKKVLVK